MAINVHIRPKKKQRKRNIGMNALVFCLLGMRVEKNANKMRSIKNGIERHLPKKNTYTHSDRQNGKHK